MSRRGDLIEGWDNGVAGEMPADPALVLSATNSPGLDDGDGEGTLVPLSQAQPQDPSKGADVRPAALTPQPPQKEKIIYARRASPRTAKFNVTMTDLDYMRARKRYDIRLPDPEAEASSAAAASAAAASAATDKNKKDKKANAKANKQAQIEAWSNAKVDLLDH